MKRALFGLLAIASLSLATGCSTVGKCGPGGCDVAGGGGGEYCGADGGDMDPCHPRLRPLKRAGGRQGGYDAGAAGPPTAAIAYPYYSVRAPRDFFEPNPPSIGY
ncbi:MAG: hypothetical protein WD875_04760 [Pirellulales bacterium]